MLINKITVCGKLQKKRKILQFASALMLAASLVSISADAQSNKRTYYRYVNEEGVKVINYTIPPEFVQKGYEIITATGQVIEVVDPAPDPAQIEALKAARAEEEEFRQQYRELKKRYSSLEDIDGAEKRKLESINTNIAIQKGNILNINAQIDALSRQAANYERANKTVPAQVLASIKELKNQRSSVEAILEQRYAKIDETKEKFEADRQMLIRGLKMDGVLPPDAEPNTENADAESLKSESPEATKSTTELSSSK